MRCLTTLSLLTLLLGATACSGGDDDGGDDGTVESLAVTTAGLPNGTVGDTYAAMLASKGGAGGDTWSISGGALPDGLTLSGANIAGTPTAEGTSTFTVRVEDSAGASATKELSIDVAPAAMSNLRIVTTMLDDGEVGQAYNTQLEAADGEAPYRWSTASTLPMGLTLSTTGRISGTPEESGTFNFNIEVVDATNTMASTTFTLFVSAPPALSIDTPMLPNGEVGVAYAASLMASGGDGNYTWAADTLPPGLTLTDTGSPATLSGTPTQNGRFDITVTLTDGTAEQTMTTYTVVIAPPPPPMQIRTTTITDAREGVAFSATIQATGGTAMGYQWSISAGQLPSGLTLGAMGTPDTTIAGVPDTPGDYAFTVQVQDTRGSTASVDLSMSVSDLFEIVTPSLPPATLGRAYATQVTAQGGVGNYAWSITGGTLPTGLTLDPTGTPSTMISGIPTSAGQAMLTITATDDDGFSVDSMLTLNVEFPPLEITTLALAPACDINLSVTLTSTGGTGMGLNWNVQQGTLPTGVTLASDGTLSGTMQPDETGVYTFTAELTDSAGTTTTRDYELDVRTNVNTAIFVGDATTNNRTEVYEGGVCGSTPDPAVSISPQNGIGDADTGSTDFAITPDGTRAVFIADFTTAGVKEVYVVDLTAAPPTAVAINPTGWGTTNDATDLRISPDGNRVAFRADGEANDQFDLYVADITPPFVANNGVRVSTGMPATGAVAAADYDFSPDSQFIVYLADQLVDEQNELFAVDLTGTVPGAPARISPALPADTNADVQDGFSWLPAGRTVVYFAEVDAASDYALLATDLSAAPATRTLTPATAGSLVFDGYGVMNSGTDVWLIGSFRDGLTNEVFTIDLTVGTSTIMMAHPALPSSLLGVTDGVRAPGDDRLLIRGDLLVDDEFELFVLDLSNPGAPVRVNAPMVAGGDIGSGSLDILWAPDGTWVSYVADGDVDGHDGVWIVGMTGTTPGGPVRVTPAITDTGLDAFDVHWAPNSSAVMIRGDLTVASQNELYVAPIVRGAPESMYVVSGTNVPTGFDVQSGQRWRADGRGIFFRSDLTADNDFELWYVGVVGRGATAPIRVGPAVPANGDVNQFSLR